MDFNRVNIKMISIVMLFVLILANSFFLYTITIEHDEQRELIKENLKNDAIAQYNNIEALIYWGAKMDSDKAQGFSLHKKDNEDGMMFALPYLAEKNKDGLYYFRLTSLHPLNSKNIADKFESRGLNKFLSDKQLMYYDEFSQNDYNFIGKLDVQETCIKCHSTNNEKVGDLRGGIHITIPLDKYKRQLAQLDQEMFKETLFLMLMLVISIAIFGVFLIILNHKDKLISNYNKNLEKEVQARTDEINTTFEQTIESFIKMVEARDSYTAGHSTRVQRYSNIIATHMQLDEAFINRLDKAAYLHDIGKLYTPDSVLLKPGKLNKLEYQLIQEHAIKGFETLNQIDSYKDIALIVGAHHERYDGHGYPHGLKKDEIPLEARIMAVADCFDAMTTNRIYRPRMDTETALKEIQSLSGKDFDPIVTHNAIIALSNVIIEHTTQLPTSGSEHQRLAYHFKDPLTNLYNLNYLNILIQNGLNGTRFACLNIINLRNFHMYNKTAGWINGNNILVELAQKLEELFPNSYIFRVFGDDFVVLNESHLEITTEDFKDCFVIQNNDIWIEVEHHDLRDDAQKNTILKMLETHS